MGLMPETLKLYLVTDSRLCAKFGVVNTVAAAVKGGVTMVQLRDKTATTAERTDLARALLTGLSGMGVPLVINDDVEAAIAAGADGVHIGQSDGAPRHVRDRLGPDRILGLSCETPKKVRAATKAPVDYLGLGPVFATDTKADHDAPIGLSGLAEMAALTAHPTVAIGGLNANHTDAIFRAGVDGMAVVSAICGQPDPDAAAQAFFKSEIQ
ncbi:MAG: thiamine phosphate synthase [Halocynthiibacter sp.]